MRRLAESEPPRADGIHKAEALRITASGAYYWKYLARAFAYMDLVIVDTPMAERDLAHQLARLADEGDMRMRFKRVRLFMNYLTNKENEELLEAARRTGPYQDSLMTQIAEQIEEEIKVIIDKLDRKGEGAA